MKGIRVRAPHKHREMLVFSGIAGLTFGVLLWVGRIYSAVFAIRLPVWLEIVLTLTLPFLVTIYWGWFCQHKLPTFFGCMVFTLSMMVVIYAIFEHLKLHSGRVVPVSEIAMIVCGVFVLSSACGLCS